MDYLEVSLVVENDDFCEILVAELSEIGFDSFLDTESGIDAYVTEELFDEQAFKQLLEEYAIKTAISYSLKKIEKKNWNEEWESNFSPIKVGKDVYVRADFHEADNSFLHNIIITPKMSFGTGHHETTSMVMELQLEIDHQQKNVLDVGTGTGILAILASKLGAKNVKSFDIDEWSVTNTLENIEINAVEDVSVRLGTINDEPHAHYEIVLANINRNILLSEIPVYASYLAAGGVLVVSGFYEHDIADIQQVAEEAQLEKVKHLHKNQWAAVVFKKK